jgi:uncharacterized protein (TIGR02594 family)
MGSPATMVAEARKHIGYRETGDNDTIFNRWFGPIPSYPAGGYGFPWCQSFLSYCLAHSGNAAAGPRTAGCSAGVAWFKSHGSWHSDPKVGDFVYYGAGGGTHVELVVGVGPGTIRTIGGNTSGTLAGAYFNGNGVYEKTVKRSSAIYGFGRPAYGSKKLPSRTGAAGGVAPITSIRSVKQQQQAVNGLGYKPRLEVDGHWGPKTAKGVRWLQKKVGAAVDGQWGQETEARYVAKR